MSGASAVLQFTGPKGEKARVYFDGGQVRHATAPGKTGVAAFNEIVNWKGGQISEVSGAGPAPRTITDDWQMLLMEAVRSIDETRHQTATQPAKRKSPTRKVLVIDDSLMLLSFVKEILSEANYQVTTAATAQEGLSSAASDAPDLILLDYILPDMKGDEVCERLGQDPVTAKVPIVYMSGFGTDLQPEQIKSASVIGSLNKPFTSDLLIKTVENYMPKQTSEPAEPEIEPAAEEQFPVSAESAPSWDQPAPLANEAPAWTEPVWSQPAPEPVASSEPAWPEPTETISPASETILPASKAISPAPTEAAETAGIASAAGATSDAWWSAPVSSSSTFAATQPAATLGGFEATPAPAATAAETEEPLPVNGAF